MISNESLKSNGWKEYEVLPENIREKVWEKVFGRDWPTQYFRNMVYNKDSEWMFVTDDGCYYKVHALYMIWVFNEATGKIGADARWSDQSLERGLNEYITDGQIGFDPHYQT